MLGIRCYVCGAVITEPVFLRLMVEGIVRRPVFRKGIKIEYEPVPLQGVACGHHSVDEVDKFSPYRTGVKPVFAVTWDGA